MKKTILYTAVLVGLAHPAYATTTCAPCQLVMVQIDEKCKLPSCTEEDFWLLMEKIPSFVPEAASQAVTEVIDTYGTSIWQLYYSGDDVSTICEALELCPDTSDCTGCTNCTSDTDWIPVSAGYMKKTERTCSCNTCKETTSYQCGPRYYGSPSDTTSGCSPCPPFNNEIPGLSDAGSTLITSCYILAGTPLSDSTGSFIYTGKCNYSLSPRPPHPNE